jgi:hypothetical protein
MDVEDGRNEKECEIAEEAERGDVGDFRFGDVPRRQDLGRDHQPQCEGESDREISQTEKPDRKSTPEAHTSSVPALA